MSENIQVTAKMDRDPRKIDKNPQRGCWMILHLLRAREEMNTQPTVAVQ